MNPILKRTLFVGVPLALAVGGLVYLLGHSFIQAMPPPPEVEGSGDDTAYLAQQLVLRVSLACAAMALVVVGVSAWLRSRKAKLP